MRLVSPYSLRTSIQLVTLPPLQPPQQHYDDSTSVSCMVAGWGHHETEPGRLSKRPSHFEPQTRDSEVRGGQLYFAELVKINTSACNELWMLAVNQKMSSHVKHLCTNGVGGKDACKGRVL